jgi:hypothetical protein
MLANYGAQTGYGTRVAATRKMMPRGDVKSCVDDDVGVGRSGKQNVCDGVGVCEGCGQGERTFLGRMCLGGDKGRVLAS